MRREQLCTLGSWHHLEVAYQVAVKDPRSEFAHKLRHPTEVIFVVVGNNNRVDRCYVVLPNKVANALQAPARAVDDERSTLTQVSCNSAVALPNVEESNRGFWPRAPPR